LLQDYFPAEENWLKLRSYTCRLCHVFPSSRSPALDVASLLIITRTCISWESPGLHHLPDYLPYICHSLWFFPQALLILFLCFMSVCYLCFMVRYLLNVVSVFLAYTLQVKAGKTAQDIAVATFPGRTFAPIWWDSKFYSEVFVVKPNRKRRTNNDQFQHLTVFKLIQTLSLCLVPMEISVLLKNPKIVSAVLPNTCVIQQLSHDVESIG
jgi:hypothetical protein